LINFCAEQADAAKRIQQALQEGRVADAQRAAHTLKGLVGTIGAHALYDAAHLLEGAIGHNGATEQLAEVACLLDALVIALQPVLTPTTPKVAGPPPPDNLETQRKAMDLLLQMLRDYDANAQRHFTVNAALFESALGEHYLRIRSVIGRLALDEALVMIEALAQPT
jgi:HPt (histidine-containing phosphotransfer) domain-containing protein